MQLIYRGYTIRCDGTCWVVYGEASDIAIYTAQREDEAMSFVDRLKRSERKAAGQ